MQEIVPIAAGILIGLFTSALRRWLTFAVIATLSMGVGALAAWLSGELSVSWIYLVIDTAQVAVAAGLTAVVVRAWLRRRGRAVVR